MAERTRHNRSGHIDPADIAGINERASGWAVPHETVHPVQIDELMMADDAIDTLAMHQAIGKQHQSAAPDVYQPVNLIEEMKKGEKEAFGIPLMSGINAADLRNEDLYALLNQRYDEAEEAYGPSENWLTDWVPPGLLG